MTLFTYRIKPLLPPIGYNRAAHSGIAVRGQGVEAVVHLLGSARRLEALAMGEHAQRLRKLADLVAAEYCHVALDDPSRRQPSLATPAMHLPRQALAEPARRETAPSGVEIDT